MNKVDAFETLNRMAYEYAKKNGLLNDYYEAMDILGDLFNEDYEEDNN